MVWVVLGSPEGTDSAAGMFDPEIEWELMPDWDEALGLESIGDSEDDTLLRFRVYALQDLSVQVKDVLPVVRWDRAAVNSWIAKHNLA
jgi:hypothetical protein